jgi:hypothetical protein
MARTLAELPKGSRITDCIGLGVLAKTFPDATVRRVLAATGRESVRRRDLPAHVVVYYVIALALFMQSSYREVLRCLLEGLQWLADPSTPIRVTGKSGISQARGRLGWEPLRRLYDEVVGPIAAPSTRGAWYRDWRVVSLDGSTLDVADERVNEAAFGRPGASRGRSAYPQILLVSLVETGTHVLFGARMGGRGHGRDDPGRGGDRKPAARHALPGRPGFLRPRSLDERRPQVRPALARQKEHGTAPRTAFGRRFVPERRLSLPQRRPLLPKRPPRAGRRIPIGGGAPGLSRSIGWRRRFSSPSARPPPNWPPCITNAGRSRRRWTNSRRTFAEPASCCAVRRPIWSARSSTDSSWRTSPSAV